MSDLVALEDLLDGMVGDDPGFDEIEWAVKEIKELETKVSMYELCGTTRLVCANSHSWLSKHYTLSEFCPWCRVKQLEKAIDELQFGIKLATQPA